VIFRSCGGYNSITHDEKLGGVTPLNHRTSIIASQHTHRVASCDRAYENARATHLGTGAVGTIALAEDGYAIATHDRFDVRFVICIRMGI